MPESGSLIGQTISHYRILELVGWGCGVMGVVYKAEDTRLHGAVILKFLQSERTDDPAVLDRLRREAQTISALNHPNIFSIYDVGEYERQPFIAMEFLDGETLDHHISGKSLPFEEILKLSIQIVDALTAAHAEGVIHRDIKPANLFVTKQGSVKVLDFGISKFSPVVGGGGVSSVATATVDTFLTTLGTVVGTVPYMSPEQARGEKLDARTDLFSFGAVLYEMATGRKAFSGNTTAEIFDAILNQTTTPLTSINPDIPPELERIVNKALEKDRKLRYQTAPEISADLQRLNRVKKFPRGMTAMGIFLLFGAVMASLAGTTLLLRGTPLDRIWALNPRAYKELAPFGMAVGIPFLLLSFTLVVASIGWFKYRPWGWGLAVAIIATQVLGNLVNVWMAHYLEGGIGIAIAGALLLYLLRADVKSAFVTGALDK